MRRARRPQINFQVHPPMKLLYEEAKASGLWVTRFCAAGLLLMVADPPARQRAIRLLREFEARYADAGPQQIRAFVAGAEAAMTGGAPDTLPARKAPRARKRARRPESAGSTRARQRLEKPGRSS